MAWSRLITGAIYTLSKPLGRFFLGIILIILGVVIGLSSHMDTYQKAPDGTYKIIWLKSGKLDLYLKETGQHYLIYPEDFASMPDKGQLDSLSLSSITYDSESEKQIDVQHPDGSTDSGNSFRIEELTLSNANGDHPITFASTEFQQDPNGVYRNSWPIGVIFVVFGAFLLLLTLFLSLRGIQPLRFRKPAAPVNTPGQPLPAYQLIPAQQLEADAYSVPDSTQP